MLAALFICILLHNNLSEYTFYTNLPDLYCGTSIFLNYNKFFDILLYFLYLLLFFTLFPIINALINKISLIFSKEKSEKIRNFLLNVKPISLPFQKILYKYQYVMLIGYVFLHPFDGKIYPKLVSLILILMAISAFDIYKRKGKSFSPWAIAPILLLIFLQPYNVEYAPLDDHHYGERFAAFFMHDKFNLQYYKDIALVHGYYDVIPGFIGKFFFNKLTVYSFTLGERLFNNLLYLASSVMALYVFSSCYIFASLVFMLEAHMSLIFFSSYILFLKDKIISKPFLWLVLYILTSYIFMTTWTTMGTFQLIAAFPAFCYILFKLIKSDNKFKAAKLLTIAGIIFIIIIKNLQFIKNYIDFSKDYIAGNIYAFGNCFPQYNLNLGALTTVFINLFSIIAVPLFILELINEVFNGDNLKKSAYEVNLNNTYTTDTNKTKRILFYAFFSLIPLISLNYTLGRIDGELYSRISQISLSNIAVVIPYYICLKFPKSTDNIIKFIFQIIMIAIIIYTFINFLIFKPVYKYSFNENINKTSLENVGNIKIPYLEKKQKEEIKKFIDDNEKKDDTILDLTKMLEKIIKNKPEIVIINVDFSSFTDNIKPSIRINPIYRYLILSGEYTFNNDYNISYLIKSKNAKYSEDDLVKMDKILGKYDLKYLPEVWANSINTLPIYEIKKEFTLNKISDNELEIIFNSPINGDETDLIYISAENSHKKMHYSIEINNSKSQIQCDSKIGANILIPADNFPSWLLNKSIKTITIKTNKPIKGFKEVRFYKRKSSDDIKISL